MKLNCRPVPRRCPEGGAKEGVLGGRGLVRRSYVLSIYRRTSPRASPIARGAVRGRSDEPGWQSPACRVVGRLSGVLGKEAVSHINDDIPSPFTRAQRGSDMLQAPKGKLALSKRRHRAGAKKISTRRARARSVT